MKLYIPTSSRNFNCIFSEESISPRAFYKLRGFGYSNWHDIPENPYENCIILYDELKSFSRPNEGYDDYPLAIEIDVPDKMKSLMVRDKKTKSYVYDGVLYFSPFTTKFIFFDTKHRDIALSKASGSLETKLVNVYLNQIVVEKANSNYDVPVIEQPILNEAELALSKRINKVKGFAYGYYIGSLLSVSKEQAARIQKYQSVLNIAAAIASSIDKRPTQRQIEQLQSLCLSSPVPKALAKEFNIDEKTASAILNYLTQHGWTPDEPTQSGSNLYYSIINPEKQEDAINWLSGKLDATLHRVSGEWKKEPELKDIEILPDATVEINRYKVEGKEEPYRLLSYWVNNIFTDIKYEGGLSSYRRQLADDLTISAKEQIYGDDWGESKTKAYMNSVRRNIAGEEFSEKWSNGILCSVASVLMKGDTWEGLRKFMLSESLYDYTLAFALFGMLTGFANLPRDFMDVLLDFADKKYTNAVYCSITDMIAAAGINAVINDDDLPEDDLPEDDLHEDKFQHEPTLASGHIPSIGEKRMDKIIPYRQEEEPMYSNTEEDVNDAYDAVVAEGPKECQQEEIAIQDKQSTFHPVFNDLSVIIEEGFANGKDRDAKVKYYTDEVKRICSVNNKYDVICDAVKTITAFKNRDGWAKVRDEVCRFLNEKSKLARIQAENDSRRQYSPGLFDDTKSYEETKISINKATYWIHDQRKFAEITTKAYDKEGRFFPPFLSDPDVFYIIQDQLPQRDEDVVRQMKADLEWFIGNYNQTYSDKKGTKPGRYKDFPRDNASVIDNYRRHLLRKQEYNPNSEWVAPIFRRVNVDRVIDVLKSKYQ